MNFMGNKDDGTMRPPSPQLWEEFTVFSGYRVQIPYNGLLARRYEL